jgi:hypothetical protein
LPRPQHLVLWARQEFARVRTRPIPQIAHNLLKSSFERFVSAYCNRIQQLLLQRHLCFIQRRSTYTNLPRRRRSTTRPTVVIRTNVLLVLLSLKACCCRPCNCRPCNLVTIHEDDPCCCQPTPSVTDPMAGSQERTLSKDHS